MAIETFRLVCVYELVLCYAAVAPALQYVAFRMLINKISDEERRIPGSCLDVYMLRKVSARAEIGLA